MKMYSHSLFFQENSEVSDNIRKKLKKDEKEIIQKEEELEDVEDKKKKERRCF